MTQKTPLLNILQTVQSFNNTRIKRWVADIVSCHFVGFGIISGFENIQEISFVIKYRNKETN